MAETKDKIFIEEKEHLAQVVAKVKESKASLEKMMEELGAYNLEKLRELRENPATNAHDFLQFMNMLSSKSEALNVADKYQQLEEFEYLSREPYFSRIDLEVGGNEEKYYIGKFGYTHEKEPEVIDWRAKLASVYYKYRYPQKDVKYETPNGEIVADLKLKRTFDIDNSELIKYYNNDIKLDESEIIAEKIDERTGGVLEDIVETIQADQHEIIEADPRRVCIVQGTVGSGKSTVAIHKLSHIFFNYPELIKPEKSILIAKNQILVGYLSTLFPKLGIFNINFGTLRDILYRIFFLEKVTIPFDLSEGQEVSDIGLDFINKMREDASQIHKKYANSVTKLFETEENEPFGGFVYDSKTSVRKNLSEAIKDLEEEVKFQKEYLKEHKKTQRAKKFGENIKIMNKIIRKLSKLRSDINSKDMPSLIKKYKLLQNGQLGYRESLIYMYFYNELIGLNKFSLYNYAVIDEGQDFGMLEYLALNNFVQKGRFCILGDLNQSYIDEGLTSWEQIYEVIKGAKDAQKFTLDTNYRSTKPIVDLANIVLAPYTNDYLPVSINRKGSQPEIIKLPTNNDVINEFKKLIESDAEYLEKSIGIITMDEFYYDKAESIVDSLNLDAEKKIKLREIDRIHYLPKAVYLSRFEDCKGLEFGKVYILGLNLEKVSNFTEAKKAFVAITRAMDDLTILYEN